MKYFIAMLLLGLFSCQSGPHKLELPVLPLVGISSASSVQGVKPGELTRKTYVAYIGAKNTYSNLYQIEPAVEAAIKKNMDFLIYVEAPSRDKLLEWLEALDFKYPVLFDEKKLFREANGETIEGYNGYIIDKNREVLGSPLIHMRYN